MLYELYSTMYLYEQKFKTYNLSISNKPRRKSKNVITVLDKILNYFFRMINL